MQTAELELLPKKLHIVTYGCQMNVYDSYKMADLLSPLGFVSSDKLEDSNVVILNTCNIREKASEKVYSELGRIKKIKDAKAAKGDNLTIIVAGCVGQAEGEEIFARAPYVDIVVGPQSYQTIPRLLRELSRENKNLLNLDFAIEPKFDALPEESASQGLSAFLTIQEGCDKFCKFCCVPFTRGPEFSRGVSDIYREALAIASKGAVEINLLGQNVSAFHGKNPDGSEVNLAKLIRYIAQIPNFKRISYTTSHPRDMDDEIIELHGTEPKLLPFLHLPVQSGSDKILKCMNRKHTAEEYLKLIEKFRKARPDMAFSSDFIVGYPGETEEDFQNTMDLVKAVGYANCYSFKYSIRPGTAASYMENQIDEEIKADRLDRLQKLIVEQQQQFNRASIGKKLNVLLDKKGRHENQATGKSEYMQAVTVENAEDLIEKIVEVQITEARQNSLMATLTKASS